MKFRLFHHFLLYCVLLLNLLNQQELFAQMPLEMKFRHLTEKDGLSYPFVFDILQDTKGYMWFLTASGLNRYDGKKMRVYLHSPNDSASLIYDWGTKLMEDKQKRLWIATSGGLCRYDPENDCFTSIKNPLTDTLTITQKWVYGLMQDSKGNIWAGTSQGLAKYNEKTKRLETYYWVEKEPKHGAMLSSIIEDETHENLWFVAADGIVKFNLTTHHYQRFQEPVPYKENPLTYNMFTSLYLDKSGTMWAGQWGGGLRIFDRKRETFTHQFLYEPVQERNTITNIVNNIQEDILPTGDSILWLATEHGLGVFNKKTKKITLIQHDPEKSESLIENGILRITKTKDNLLWIGTRSSGIDRVSLTPSKIRTWKIPVETKEKLYPFITDIEEDKRDSSGNSFWIAMHDNGLYYWNLISHKYEYFPFANNPNESAYSRDFWRILKDKNEKIWLTTGKGIYFFDILTKKFHPINGNDEKLHQLPFYEAYQDKKGNLWFSVFWRLKNELAYHFCKYNPQTGTSEWGKIPNCPTAISKFHEDALGNIYLCSRRGGSIYCIKNGELQGNHYEKWAHNYRDKNSLPFPLIFGFSWENNDHVWLSGENPVLYDLKNRKPIQTFSVQEGMSHNYTYDALLDSLQNIWFFTRKGLTRYHRPSKQFTSFYEEDGLFDNYLETTNYLSSQNVILMGWETVLQYFHPQRMLHSSPFPQLAFTEIQVMTKPQALKIDTAGNMLPISLTWNQNVVRFEFAAFEYTHPERIQYAYKLEGFNADWVSAGTQNMATYTNLSGGTYTFRVKSTNAEGNWNPKEISLILIVHPPFWKTLWFALLMGALGLGVIYFFYQSRIQRIMQMAEFQNKLNEVNLKALRSQMNPHFIFNSLNAIDKYILMSDEMTASSYLNKFARLMRLILNHSERNFVSLKEEILMLEYYLQLENLRMEQKFTYQIDLAEELTTENFAIPSMLLQPYVENAIRHGFLHKSTAGNLKIRLTLTQEECIYCVIEDDGIGRSRSAELKQGTIEGHDSKAMKITQDRLAILNNSLKQPITLAITDLINEKGEASGTKVELWFPFQS
ncbi:MAG: two-component regulator propeller domain-containing protein [Bacteroidia bacterium]